MKTNFECIRVMTIDEMHEFLDDFYTIMNDEALKHPNISNMSYNEAIKEWLKGEASWRFRHLKMFKSQITEPTVPARTNFEYVQTKDLNEMYDFLVWLFANKITTGHILDLSYDTGSYNDALMTWLKATPQKNDV